MQTQFLDLYRAGVRSMFDVMNGSLQNALQLQQQQLELLRTALNENNRTMAEFWTSAAPAAASDLAREGYAPAERASEDALEMAASQVAAAVGQAREVSRPRRAQEQRRSA